jgi:uncharacterized membrane protein
MSGIAANPSAQGHLARQAKRQRMREEEDLRHVMGSEQGRRFLVRVVDAISGVMNGSFAGDPYFTAFNEGKRAVGQTLYVEARRVAPDLYALALTEAYADAKAVAAERELAEHQEDNDG